MTKRFISRRIFFLMSAAGLLSVSDATMAAAFQLWEQDAASIGNYHAGVAAIADDASTNWYNAAGLVRIKNQQLVVGSDAVLTNFRFKGTVGTNTLFDFDTGLVVSPQPVNVQGGGFNAVPFGHYAAPINKDFVFGLSVDVPFGLKTNYGTQQFSRYAATLTSVQVVDVSPSLGVAVTDKFSFGLGFDVQRLSTNLDVVGTAGDPDNDMQANNEGSDTGYGYHLGALYQFTPQTRAGLGYHSKVRHHVTGNSYFIGPLANNADGGAQASTNLATNVTLPAVTTLSLFHNINSCWDVLGTVAYTQWSVFKDIILQNVAGVQEGVSSNTILVDIPERYRNSWNYSVGANYHPNENWILRTGVGYDETPSSDTYRNLQLPDSSRVAVALGAHYQVTKTIGLDGGWTHIFAMNTRINNLSQAFGDQITTTNGSVSAGADVYGLQVKWDIT